MNKFAIGALFLFILFVPSGACTILGGGLLFSGDHILGGLGLLAFSLFFSAGTAAYIVDKQNEKKRREKADRAVIEMNERQKRSC